MWKIRKCRADLASRPTGDIFANMKHIVLIFCLATALLTCEFRMASAQEPCTEKLRKVVFEKIQFDETDVVEAFGFIRKKSKEDDPDGKGLNIVLKGIKKGESAITLELDDIPAGDLVRYICIAANLEFKVETYAIIISRKEKK